MALGTAAVIGSSLIGGAASGQQGQSNSSAFGMSSGEESSWGNSVSDSWGNQYSDAFGSASGQSYGYGNGENWSQGKSWNEVFGSAASARDIERAAEANAQQEYFARMQMAYNAEQAQIARDYETMMSNTAYQRAVADLKKAGLNPILAAANMGASTPTGAVASSGMASSAKAQTFADQSGGSTNSSYGYNKSENRSSYSSKNESHSRGSTGSHGESASGSKGKSGSFNTSKSSSQNTNNLAKFFQGIGDLLSGLSSAQKTYPGDSKGTGKSAFDGYDMPTVSN